MKTFNCICKAAERLHFWWNSNLQNCKYDGNDENSEPRRNQMESHAGFSCLRSWWTVGLGAIHDRRWSRRVRGHVGVAGFELGDTILSDLIVIFCQFGNFLFETIRESRCICDRVGTISRRRVGDGSVEWPVGKRFFQACRHADSFAVTITSSIIDHTIRSTFAIDRWVLRIR